MNKTRKNQRFLVSQSSERNFRKVGIFMVFVLFVSAVFLSGCQQDVGRRLTNVDDERNQRAGIGDVSGEGGGGSSCSIDCYDADGNWESDVAICFGGQTCTCSCNPASCGCDEGGAEEEARN